MSGIKRTKIIKIRVTDEEFSAIKRRAGRGQVARFVRASALDQPLAEADQAARERRKPPSVDPALLRELAKWGNNLNQIARHANQLSIIDKAEVLLALAQLDANLDELREEYRRK